jgi:hypothetical protein
MWITLLVMAVAISLEPFRISMTVLLINRLRPLLQLLVFLAGGCHAGRRSLRSRRNPKVSPDA